MWTLAFWKDTTERMLRAASAGVVAYFGTTQFVLSLHGTNWVGVGIAAALAAGTSLILSLAGSTGLGTISSTKGNPSFIK
jgi:r1t holin